MTHLAPTELNAWWRKYLQPHHPLETPDAVMCRFTFTFGYAQHLQASGLLERLLFTEYTNLGVS